MSVDELVAEAEKHPRWLVQLLIWDQRIKRAWRAWMCREFGHRRPTLPRAELLPPNWWQCPRCKKGWLS